MCQELIKSSVLAIYSKTSHHTALQKMLNSGAPQKYETRGISNPSHKRGDGGDGRQALCTPAPQRRKRNPLTKRPPPHLSLLTDCEDPNEWLRNETAACVIQSLCV